MINDLMLNFNEFLKKTIFFLRKADIAVGDDAWDKFQESNFESLVLIPLFQNTGVSLQGVYGSKIGEPGLREILVRVKDPKKALLGKVTAVSDYGVKTVSYEENKSEEEITFTFVQFYDVCSDVDNLEKHFSHVSGFMLDGEKEISVCVELSNSIFLLKDK